MTMAMAQLQEEAAPPQGQTIRCVVGIQGIPVWCWHRLRLEATLDIKGTNDKDKNKGGGKKKRLIFEIPSTLPGCVNSTFCSNTSTKTNEAGHVCSVPTEEFLVVEDPDEEDRRIALRLLYAFFKVYSIMLKFIKELKRGQGG